jgi:carotenoid cleavage dioxygenase-like enzyme
MKKNTASPFVLQHIYPKMRYFLGLGGMLYQLWVKVFLGLKKRRASSVVPTNYTVWNKDTVDSQFDLNCISGELPEDIEGSLFIAQCLGSPKAFMVGETNIVRLEFDRARVKLTNRRMMTPASLAYRNLYQTKYKFDFLGLMYLSPGVGMFSYTEGMYLLPDARIAVTSDIDRPWVIDRTELRTETPIGRRDEWLPMLNDSAGEALGKLFAGYNTSHAIQVDHYTGEVFLVNFLKKQSNGEHPVYLIRWDGQGSFERWLVVDEVGKPIEIEQSIHELVFSKDYILLTDTAFVTDTEIFFPWKSAPLPRDKTVIYAIVRRELKHDSKTVVARRMEVNEACIHLVAEYDNPDDSVTVYMLHTPATNTAELIREHDRDLNGQYFSKSLIGYGTLPVLDLSSIGKHILNMKQGKVTSSQYLSQLPYTWGPYLYTYAGAKTAPFHGQDLFVMFKGFSKDILPERIFHAYKNIGSRRVALDQMVVGNGLQHNNSICRIATNDLKIIDAYVFPDRALLLTMAYLESKDKNHPGYLLAGVVTESVVDGVSSGHEYWLFRADDLARGAICKLGHPELNNSTLFHGVYIPTLSAKHARNDAPLYHISLRDDFSEDELKNWGDEILSVFREVIWPYFDPTRSDQADRTT